MTKVLKKSQSLFKNRKFQVMIACVLIGCIIIAFVIFGGNSTSGTDSYRETQVAFGNLTVGITESGTIDVGTVEQTFELDMSALTRVTTSNSNSSSGSSGGMSSGMSGGMGGMTGGMGGSMSSSAGSASATSMFGNMFNMGGNSTTTSNSSSSNNSSLVVDSIAISVGQSISVGDVILTLESEGVEELKTELEENTQKASADLEALIADQKLSTVTAEYTLSTALKYGEYAETEKNNTINSLKEDVETAQSALDQAKKNLTRYQEQLATAQADYEDAKVAMDHAVWTRDNSDKNNELYWYTEAFKNAETAISNAESLESKVEQLESRVESAQSNVERAESTLAKAKRQYKAGLLSAQETYDLRMLAYNTAQETYDITTSYLEDDLASQQKTYDDTLSKWNEFNSYIDGVNILSEYNGVVTAISLEKGDGLNTGATVITLYDADDVTMTVTVSEDDMTDIELDGKANISLTAYPNEVFEATVTDISDATTDNSGNTTRDVTVTIKGDLSKLFQGMTGEVTFITKQNADVLYVSNRAIILEKGISYVKVKKENGSIEKVQVTTGFSDGVNVEIMDGLTEGQTVIIEKGES